MLHVPSMEGLELGSEAYMQPLDACRPVTTCLAAGDMETRLLNEPLIARLCVQLLMCELAESEALCRLLSRSVRTCREETWPAFALIRRLSAVLLPSKHDNAAGEVASLTADRRAGLHLCTVLLPSACGMNEYKLLDHSQEL